MLSEDLIPAGEFCTFHHVELSFLQNLYESGLIAMTIRNGAVFLEAGQLPAVEKFVRWHYELAINPEGIEALSHVLGYIDNLQAENQQLRNRLRRFESNRGDNPTVDYEL
jgi:chaperone modulatory protein CbpM